MTNPADPTHMARMVEIAELHGCDIGCGFVIRETPRVLLDLVADPIKLCLAPSVQPVQQNLKRSIRRCRGNNAGCMIAATKDPNNFGR